MLQWKIKQNSATILDSLVKTKHNFQILHKKAVNCFCFSYDIKISVIKTRNSVFSAVHGGKVVIADVHLLRQY